MRAEKCAARGRTALPFSRLPEELGKARIIEISLPSLVAGTKYRGEFEERMEAVISEASTEPKPILFIDEIHLLLGAGQAGCSMDAANILKLALARDAIRLIGATTSKEYRQTIEKDGALERRFQPPAAGSQITQIGGREVKAETLKKMRFESDGWKRNGKVRWCSFEAFDATGG